MYPEYKGWVRAQKGQDDVYIDTHIIFKGFITAFSILEKFRTLAAAATSKLLYIHFVFTLLHICKYYN